MVKREDIIKAKQEATEPTREVMQRLHDALLTTPEFVLADGTTARVESFYAPEADDDGELSFGVDVVLDNGNHLEFTVKQTGWGRSFVAARTNPKAKGPRTR